MSTAIAVANRLRGTLTYLYKEKIDQQTYDFSQTRLATIFHALLTFKPFTLLSTHDFNTWLNLSESNESSYPPSLATHNQQQTLSFLVASTA